MWLNMKRIFKKNQIVIFVIGLMLITAGYLNFTNTEQDKSLEAAALADAEEMASLGDARLVSTTNVVETNEVSDETAGENLEETNSLTENIIENSSSENNEEVSKTDEENGANNDEPESEATQETSASNTEQYFTTSKLERETMYSQRIENYQEILNNANVSEAQKKLAQDEITAIGEEQNAIMIAENLIKTKGIEDLIIFVNGDNVNVIVKGEELEKTQIAQVQNIIMRELNAKIENIHIMNK